MNSVILDARSREAFKAGHREGAIHADLETQLSSARDPGADPARGGRHPLPPVERWLAQVAEWGIKPETRVTVYDDQNGANAAARVWWMLRAIGIENVDVQHVGTGFSPSGARAEARATLSWQLPTVTLQDVDRLRNDPEWRVLDVRATPRFRGDTEPIDPVAGHIPGAVNLPYTENSGKSPAELRAMYEELLGGVPPERLIVHCGSGVTACQTLLALEMAGLRGASLYVGSWGEWCRNDMPIGKVRE
ncbi:MAG TPA: rhodanese-like domain-containing protein [Thermoanaerobaculia bacterium]|nr:rhodanese-like domain-containing protein [Thermoanaerobaculia bacterium]